MRLRSSTLRNIIPYFTYSMPRAWRITDLHIHEIGTSTQVEKAVGKAPEPDYNSGRDVKTARRNSLCIINGEINGSNFNINVGGTRFVSTNH